MDNTERISTTELYPDGTKQPGEAEVVSEHILDVIVNETPVYSLVCSKTNLKELVVGRLFTDGVIEGPDDIDRIFFCRYENEASVFLKKDVRWEGIPVVRNITCCTGNRVFASSNRPELKKLAKKQWNMDWVFDLAREFAKDSELHSRTGGTHSCILSVEGTPVFTAEDIGRHNAVDKAVGHMILNRISPGDCMLFTSGRVPTDMVEKVIAAGIPFLVSKSVPTKESVEMAARYGLTLIGRARPDRCEIF